MSSISISLEIDHLLWIMAVAPNFAMVNIINDGFYALTLYKAVYCGYDLLGYCFFILLSRAVNELNSSRAWPNLAC